MVPDVRELTVAGVACVLLACIGLGTGSALLGAEGSEVYGHAWVWWWHGEALPAWPEGTDLASGTGTWPVIDPLPTALGGLLGRLVGHTLAWNLLAILGIAGAFSGGAFLARRVGGEPLVGGVVLGLGPIVLGSFASGLTEDWALGLVAVALALLISGPAWVAGLLLGLSSWCGLYLALGGAMAALWLGGWRIATDRSSWRSVVAGGLLAAVLTAPTLLLQGDRIEGEGHRAGALMEQSEPMWKLNPWKGSDIASFVTPGRQDPEGALLRRHPTYLGFAALLLAVAGGRSRWWPVLAGAGVLALGERLRFAGEPLGLDNPAVTALRAFVPGAELVNHHGRLFLVGQIALAALASIGASRLRGRFERPRLAMVGVAALVAAELAFLSPMALPLPTTPARVDPIFSSVGEGVVLVVPVAGPGIAYQRPLYEQRAHGQRVLLAPNRPGMPPSVGGTALGHWLGGLAFSEQPAPSDAVLEQLHGHVDVLVVREAWVEQVTSALGPPTAEVDGDALWRVP